MNSLGVLKSITGDKGIDSSVADAFNDVSGFIDGGLLEVEKRFSRYFSEATFPVDEIAKYTISAGGKRIRPSLTLISSRISLNSDIEKPLPVELALVLEMLHNATLLHDDVIDEGDMRRGKPAARKVWSNALSILGGDFMLMKCIESISRLDSSYMTLFVETLKLLVNGEIVQLSLREKIGTTVDDYFKIVSGKTSSLFKFATSSGAMWSGLSQKNCDAMGLFGENIGMAFQLIDDVLDFSSDSHNLGKNMLADISQGKLTLPLIEASKKSYEINILLRQLIDGASPSVTASKISDIVNSCGALQNVKKRAEMFTKVAVRALDEIETPNPQIVLLLKELANVLLHRTK
ncbi:MAG: polyprenyl synthetase family protein [Deltaproteobacteria bacterium]|nr:polyprenyl synthetase family protein [Deltaproteobacteria bacterium]